MVLSASQDRITWRRYRAWAIARCSGRWPLTVLGGDEVPTLLATCGKCEAPDVSIIHGLCHCPGTASFWVELAEVVNVPVRHDSDAVVRYLFNYDNVVASRSLVIDFVGSSLIACMAKQAPHPQVRGDDGADSENEDGESRLLAMLRLDMEEAGEVGRYSCMAEVDRQSGESGAEDESASED